MGDIFGVNVFTVIGIIIIFFIFFPTFRTFVMDTIDGISPTNTSLTDIPVSKTYDIPESEPVIDKNTESDEGIFKVIVTIIIAVIVAGITAFIYLFRRKKNKKRK